ncbi:tyrosine-tRNA ligase [Reticulomyxa filosa]|uniref:tyrosine--tRNA ligase n=1 Tax=Reticulomyxa filosa TaxID=46433 RepID=X6MJ56_RETFI|nr:tyrosine-tRNA ligase [Reticulomyxa filosa]|eukprot:ETO13105.1 tyrosine-tRNA ligase [Reticulomyxa filosa]
MFVWCSQEINENANDYWLRVMDISKQFNVTRTKRCCTVMGRTESDDMPTAHLLYACMQCADIFFLRADICQLGMDQRKVNMLAREYAAKQKWRPPIVISHHMLMGLKEGQEKMSKSDPDSAIFMEDEPRDVNLKIKQAFCPPGQVEKNPCLDYVKHIVFGKLDTFLEQDYVAGNLHPQDLKGSLAEAINSFLEPVRQHFKNDENAKQLLAQVKKFRVTK